MYKLYEKCLGTLGSGEKMDAIWMYTAYVVIIVIGMYCGKIYVRYKFKKIALAIIRDNYGTKKHIEKDYVNHDEQKNSYFLNSRDKNFFVDDITWNDFNMEEIFKILANTNSSVGSEYLYKALRVLSFDKLELEKRKYLIDFFRNNMEAREKVPLLIRFLGRKNSAHLSDYFMTESKSYKFNVIYFKIMRYSLVVFLILGCINPIFFLALLINIIANMILHMRIEKRLEYKMQDYSYMVNMIGYAEEIFDENIDEINNKYPHMKENLCRIKKLKKKRTGSNKSNMGNDLEIFSEYVGMLTLKSIINFGDIEKVLIAERQAIKETYDFIGELDSLIAVASFMEGLEEYCIPNFIEENKIEFKDIYNPLIKKPIKNSFEGNGGILITGSNASGKSTFLRSIGVNIIFAQSFNFVCAKEFNIPFLRIYSSMALSDSILSNDSYYMAEIKAINRILNAGDENFICFIDEVLRGTNTLERIAASSEILNKLGKMKNCICFGATHDIELTYILENIFKNYNFEEHIDGRKIKFDYKLKRGPSKTRNAIKILDFIGYEKEIIDRAEDNVDYFVENNKWRKL